MVAIQGNPRCARVHSMPVNSGERPGEATDDVADDRQTEWGEARRIAVGIQHQRRDLRTRALDHVREDGPSTKRAQALVTATHAPRLTAGEQHADHRPSAVAGDAAAILPSF